MHRDGMRMDAKSESMIQVLYCCAVYSGGAIPYRGVVQDRICIY